MLYDAVVVGSGPNGLAAAITMQQAGLAVLLVEGADTIGGGMRTCALTLPGFLHDVCSAVHPMAVSAPFFQSLRLEQYGLEFIDPPLALAHPFDDGTAAILHQSIEKTASYLGDDSYKKIVRQLHEDWPQLLPELLAPLHWPKHPLKMARFGLWAIESAIDFAEKRMTSDKTKALWAGVAAHSMLPLNQRVSAAIGLVLLLSAHYKGWPIPKGGSGQIAEALGKHFVSLGGTIQTGCRVRSLDELPPAKAILMDVTPKQLLAIAGNRLSSFYKKRLNNFRYGMGVFKIDWALHAPIPFTAVDCGKAGTIHLGNSSNEIAAYEQMCWNGKPAAHPFVLLTQPSVFDASRAPEGKHTAWAYCHTPLNAALNMTEAIEAQVERFAPGFKDCILARHTMNSKEMETYNPNYVGGDINGGAQSLSQLFTRPVLSSSPYQTPAQGLYICSSSTPPGGGVHGMCGWHAAQRALKDVFHIRIPSLS